MFRCILQAADLTYYVFNDGKPTLDIQEALCFEDRSDAEWEQSTNSLFKEGSKIIPVILQEDGSVVAYPTMYLVVSYKPTKHDYVRNCHMGTYNSKHEMKVFHNEEDIIEHLAKLDASLEQLDTDYRHWIITQDMIANGYNWFDDGGKLPTYIEEKVAARVKELKKK
jgi:hypothetical protein